MSTREIIRLIARCSLHFVCSTALIDQRQCAGSEPAVQARLESLASQWETLVAKSAEKSEKLKEASRQQTYNAGVKDVEFWLGEVISYYITGLTINQKFI